MDEGDRGSPNPQWRVSVLGIGIFGLAAIGVATIFIVRANTPKPIIPDPLGPRHVETMTKIDRLVGTCESYWRRTLVDQTGNAYVAVNSDKFRMKKKTPCNDKGEVYGSFFCPADGKISFDYDFFEGMDNELSMSYAIAHIVAHHVQDLLDKDHNLKIRFANMDASQFALRRELQADFLAGMSLKRGTKPYSDAEIEKIFKAVESQSTLKLKGKDTLDPLTHGTLPQRIKWFMKGYKSGRIKDGDTFHAKEL